MHRKILIADDNVATQTEMQRLLLEQGYEVITVGNGDLVIEKMHEFQPHVVMLDIIMPGKNGYEVCGYIKNEPELNQIPVILTFSEDEPFDLSEARRVGATRCLPKTIDPESLTAILNFIWAGVTPIEFTESLPDVKNIEYLQTDDVESDVEVEPVSDGEPVPVEEVTSYVYEVRLRESSGNMPTVKADPSQFSIPSEAAEVEASNLASRSKNIVVAAYESQKISEPRTLVAAVGGQNHQPELQNQFSDSPISGYQLCAASYEEESPDDPLQIKDDLISSHCCECGARVAIGDVFCVECGAGLDENENQESEKPNCGQCGQGVNLGDVFCLNCGSVQ